MPDQTQGKIDNERDYGTATVAGQLWCQVTPPASCITKGIAAACAGFTAAFGWLGWMVVAWVVCMGADYVSGSAAAAKAGEWSSEKARAGLWHKAGMIFVVFAAGVTDAVLGMLVQNLPGFALEYTALLLPLVLAWYSLTELGSIAENAALLGAPVPGWLVRILKVDRDLVDKNAPEMPDDDERGGNVDGE